jgi:hypothetical protein
MLLSNITGANISNVKIDWTAPTTVLLRPEEFLSRGIWTRRMSTFGNDSIERLRTKLVHVQPQNRLGEESIALEMNLIFIAKGKRGSSNEQSALYVFFAGYTAAA